MMVLGSPLPSELTVMIGSTLAGVKNRGGDQQCPGAHQAVRTTGVNQCTATGAHLLIGVGFLLVQLMAFGTNQNACINRPHGHLLLTKPARSDEATSQPPARPGPTTN